MRADIRVLLSDFLISCGLRCIKDLKLETYFHAHPDIVNISTDKYMCLYRVRTLKVRIVEP